LPLCTVAVFADAAGAAAVAGAPVAATGVVRLGLDSAPTTADRGVNVVQMATRLVGDEPLYVMLLEVALPTGMDEAALEETLGRASRELGVDVSVRALDADVL
jgi:hypothetical protein